jgi:hypothetical protein
MVFEIDTRAVSEIPRDPRSTGATDGLELAALAGGPGRQRPYAPSSTRRCRLSEPSASIHAVAFNP